MLNLFETCIGKIVDKSHFTVNDIINRYKKSNLMANKPRTNSRKLFTEADEHWIIRKIKKDPKLSGPQLAKGAEKYLGEKANYGPQLAKGAEKYLGEKANYEIIRKILRNHDFSPKKTVHQNRIE
ncbi:hypothetical protein QE152_g19246 [Popillia japonica]|uniref:HTH merR-type domain-containing protein n=1 Tax=Popillia japonica TaxID=7064 RepID=A0AAW1KSA1_POPJA